ncbi:MAG: response regulator [Candidatus Omnitrophica bacterium]|nr:response regulator [Candidatus Omnitrophota bacterium]
MNPLSGESLEQLEESQLDRSRRMSLNKKQIYIVDDDESVCRSLKLLIASYGLPVKTFTSAEEFFSAVPNGIPGCLIMDIHMPGLKGWEAQERLLKSGSKRAVIIITVDKDNGLKEKVLKEGALGFLQKPINEKELMGLIRQSFIN